MTDYIAGLTPVVTITSGVYIRGQTRDVIVSGR